VNFVCAVAIKLLASLIILLAVLVNRFAYLKKKFAVGKIKNTEEPAMSLGSVAV
jgi:hypothetical protein